MVIPLRCFLSLILAFILYSSDALAASCSKISALKEIKLHYGLNNFHDFDEYGGNVQILKIRQTGDNAGNTHNTYISTLEQNSSNGTFIFIVDGSRSDISVDDAPFDGDFSYKSVRFAKGKCDGKKATFLVTAERKTEGSSYDPSFV